MANGIVSPRGKIEIYSVSFSGRIVELPRSARFDMG